MVCFFDGPNYGPPADIVFAANGGTDTHIMCRGGAIDLVLNVRNAVCSRMFTTQNATAFEFRITFCALDGF
jgi:hypothetical protein